jgi:spore coat polysaccharide biosynthesis protein SpsF
MKTIAIIQARIGSTRLRGKSLMMLSNYSLLETVVRSVKRNTYISKVIVATSNLPEDDAIQELCLDKGFECYRGDSLDVLSRFIAVAETLEKEDTIVRVTADNPINNHKASKRVFDRHIENNNDYTCVRGLSHSVYEFIKVEALLKLKNAEDLMADDREHVTMYLRQRPEVFRISEIDPDSLGLNSDLDKLLTVDRKEDYERFMNIKQKINIDEVVNMNELYEFLIKNA